MLIAWTILKPSSQVVASFDMPNTYMTEVPSDNQR